MARLGHEIPLTLTESGETLMGTDTTKAAQLARSTFGSEYVQAMNAEPKSATELRIAHGSGYFEPVQDYVTVGPMDVLQQYPSNEKGMVDPGRVGKVLMTYNRRRGGGTSSDELKLYVTEWMAGRHGFKSYNEYMLASHRYNPNAHREAYYLIFKNVNDRWRHVDSLASGDPYRRTGYVSLMRRDEEGNDLPPVIGTLKSALSHVNEDILGDDPEKTRRKIGKRIEIVGKHFEEEGDNKDYDYRTDPRISETERSDAEQFINVNLTNPMILISVMIAWEETKKIQIERELRAKHGLLTPDDIGLMEDRLDHLRAEVQQADDAGAAEPYLSMVQARNGTKANPVRWTAELITVKDVEMLARLANSDKKLPDSTRQKAAQLFLKYRGIRSSALLIRGTAGNEVICNNSYKPGEDDHLGTPAGPQPGGGYSPGSYTYTEGMPTMPVHQPYGAFPSDIVRSLVDDSLPNQVPGLVCSVQVTGDMMPEDGDDYLIVNANAAPYKIGYLADAHEQEIRRRLREQGLDAILPAPKTLEEWLASSEVESTLTITLHDPKNGSPIQAILPQGGGIELMRSQDGHKIRARPTQPVVRPRISASPAPLPKKPAKERALAVVSRDGKKVLEPPDPNEYVERYTVQGDENDVHEGEVAIAGVLVGLDMKLRIMEDQSAAIVQVLPNDKTELFEKVREARASAKKYGGKARK